jgi:hypothetical protein
VCSVRTCQFRSCRRPLKSIHSKVVEASALIQQCVPVPTPTCPTAPSLPPHSMHVATGAFNAPSWWYLFIGYQCITCCVRHYRRSGGGLSTDPSCPPLLTVNRLGRPQERLKRAHYRLMAEHTLK